MKPKDIEQLNKLRADKKEIEIEINKIMLKYNKEEYLDIRSIKKQVIDFYSIMYSVGDFEILSNSRLKDFQEPRILCIMVLKNYYGIGVERIGRMFNKTHAAIIYLLKKGEKLSISNDLFAKRYNLYKDNLEGSTK